MKVKSTQVQEDIKNAFAAFNQGQVRAFDAILSLGTVSWKDVDPEDKQAISLVERVLIHGPSLMKKSSINYSEPSRSPFMFSLIQNGWDPKRPLPNGILPIFQVLSSGKIDLAQALVNVNVPVNELDDAGHSVLFRAILSGRFSPDANSSYATPSDGLLKHLFQRGARFASEEEEQEAFQVMLQARMRRTLKIFQNDWTSFKPNLPLKSGRKFYAPTLFWGAVRYGFLATAEDVEMWALSGADGTITDKHKKGVLHALLDGVENKDLLAHRHVPATAYFVQKPVNQPSPEWALLKQFAPVLMELGRMGARWTQKKKLGTTAFERLEELVLKHDAEKKVDYADLEKVLGEQVAYTIRAQSTREKLQGLPQADVLEEEQQVIRVSKRRL